MNSATDVLQQRSPWPVRIYFAAVYTIVTCIVAIVVTINIH